MKITIIGAGITGLSLAWHLQKRFKDTIEITILEKSERAGGYLDSQVVNGHFFEKGPRHFKGEKCQELLELIDDMDLSEEIVFSDKKSNVRYVYMQGKLYPIPTNLFSFFTSPLTRNLLPIFYKEYKKRSNNIDDESILSFLRRRFGKSKEIETLFNVLIQGIYAGDIEKLSMKSCFAPIFEGEQKHGSVLKSVFKSKKKKSSHKGLFRLKKGTKSLVHRLQSKIDAKWMFQQEVQNICIEKKQIILPSQNISSDYLFICTPVKQAAQLLGSLGVSQAKILSEIPRVTLSAVNLGYNRSLITKKGFGYLVPSFEQEKALGCIWESNIYSQKPDKTRLTVMMGGAFHPDISLFSDAQKIEIAQDALKRHMNITEKPEAVLIGGAIDALPLYHVGHDKNIKALNQALAQNFPRIFLAGNYLSGPSVNSCIQRSKSLVEALGL